jgi:hypothetical protein
MTEATQPRMARGMRLPAAIVAAALFALLAFAPLASATPDPVASGSTTITLNKGWTKYLKTFGIKIQKISPTKLKGQKATFPVNGGEMDPTNGLGTLNLAGGLKFKAGKKKTTVKGLVLDTGRSVLTGKVGGKKVKLANLKGLSYERNGFGVNVRLKKLKLNKAAAKQLNKKLGFAKGKPKPFLGGKTIGKSSSESQPTTVAIIPGHTLRFATSEPTIKKLLEAGVTLNTIAPTEVVDPTLTHPVFDFPITGGSVGPAATAGTVQSNGGLELIQEFATGGEPLKTEITLGNFYLDLSAKTVSVEVVAHSNASKSLDLGALGRSSIADVSLTGATVTSDPVARTVSVSNASATLQPIAAEVLDAFRKVAEAVTVEFLVKVELVPKELAEKLAAEKYANAHINAGDPLGNFSFTAQTQ